jgi:hypothetical protein
MPASVHAVLTVARPCVRARTFATLVVGLVMTTGRRTSCGMLLGAGIAGQVAHDRFHRFFSHTRWDVDQLGLAIARVIVTRLLAPDAAITVAVDDTLVKRWGRKVYAVLWTHDGSTQAGHVIGRGNRWIVAGTVVTLFVPARCACRCCFGSGAARAPPPTSPWRPSGAPCS